MGGHVTVIDGGMGKELARIGAPFGQPEWSALALIEDPDQVLEAHENFIDAGAELITTNAYAVVPFHLGEERHAQQGRELIELAGELARQAADEADHPVLVAGCLPPVFGSYRPEHFDPDQAPELLAVLIEAQAPFVDLWLAETISSLAEFEAVVAALRTHVDNGGEELELWASFSVSDYLTAPPQLRSGEGIATMVEAVSGQCSALLLNCASPEAIDGALRVMAPLLGDGSTVPFGAYANAFEVVADAPANEGLHQPREDVTPTSYADLVARWVELGATIVGGCCGIDPHHIAALVALADS